MSSADPESHARALLRWFDSPGADRPLLLIAGPCMLEDREVNLRIGHELRDVCRELGIEFVFKASFDKANRSSVDSARGPGLFEGLEALAELREELQVPTCTDIHQPEQAEPAANSVSLLQVPAFLCRQTDLLSAVAETGRPINVKKGQFLAPEQMDAGHLRSLLAEATATQYRHPALPSLESKPGKHSQSSIEADALGEIEWSGHSRHARALI